MTTLSRLVGGCLLSGAAFAAPLPVAAQRQVELPRQSHEVQCLSLPARGKGAALARQVEGEANQRGAEGWLLAGMVLTGGEAVLCFTRPQVVVNTEVSRIPEGKPRPELSGNWTELDSKEAAEKIVAECFTAPAWLGGKTASIRVGRVVNRTDEHLDARAIIAQVEKAILATKKLRVLASDAPGAESAGADFLLNLTVVSLLDQVEGVRIKHYQVAAEVLRAANGQKVCIGSAEITKAITQAPAVW